MEEARNGVHEEADENPTSSLLPDSAVDDLFSSFSEVDNSAPKRDVPNNFTKEDITTTTSTSETTTTETPCKPSSSTYNNGKRPCTGEILDDSIFVFKNENIIGSINPVSLTNVFTK